VSAIADGQGLNLTAVSYDGVLAVTAVACRNMLPDPAFFADCLRESFAELLAAASAMATGAGNTRKRKNEGAATTRERTVSTA
jgi:diacylglycerol O-acyltransferase / wax synthase